MSTTIDVIGTSPRVPPARPLPMELVVTRPALVLIFTGLARTASSQSSAETVVARALTSLQNNARDDILTRFNKNAIESRIKPRCHVDKEIENGLSTVQRPMYDE